MKRNFLVFLVLLVVVSFAYAANEPGTIESHNTSSDSRSLNSQVQETGLISWSIDGFGSTSGTGTIQVEKPAGTTVRTAYLFAATVPSGSALSAGDVKLDGEDIAWDGSATNVVGGIAINYYKDVTDLVSSKINLAATGTIDFTITELSSGNVSGEILAVIFNNPNQTEEVTIAFFFGGQETTGDQFNIGLAEPVDATTEVYMSLGISYSYQPGGQVSLIDVNGTRLTTSAGGQDDGEAANGALITVGGIGDSYDNPPDANAAPTDTFYDDELYSLSPFLSLDETQIQVDTSNPSGDDNIFFAAFNISGAAIIGEGCLLTPTSAAHPVGEVHTETATLQDEAGAPVVGKTVNFEVTSGPHVGTTGSDDTDASGKAYFTYTGVSVGTDIIEASFLNSAGSTQDADIIAEITWENQLPVELSSFTGTFNSDLYTSTLNWTTQSESNNLGWNVYKSQTENAANSMILNAELIPGAGGTTEPTYYSFIDDTDLADNVTYYYWIEDVTYGNISTLHGPINVTVTEAEGDPNAPEIVLETIVHNYPNPFNPNTKIYFSLKENEVAEKIEIYNSKGQIVNSFNLPISPQLWNGKDIHGSVVPSGIYMYKLITNKNSYSKKMVLSK